MMKKRTSLFRSALVLLLLTTSCNDDWLDYSPVDMYSAAIDTDDSDAPSFLNVAAVSIQPSKTDKQSTLENMKQTVETVKREQPDTEIIVFPELALEWYQTDENGEQYQRDMAESIPGNASDFMTRVAADYNVVVVFGMAEIDNTTDKLYNSQVLIRPDGELVKYRKRNLNGVDKDNGMTPGENKLVTVTVGQAECAMFICSDMQSASITDEINNSDVDVILHSLTSSTDLNEDISYVGLQMNKWIVFANRYGTEDQSDYTGFIQIINPTGTVSKRAEGKDVYVYRKLGIY